MASSASTVPVDPPCVRPDLSSRPILLRWAAQMADDRLRTIDMWNSVDIERLGRSLSHLYLYLSLSLHLSFSLFLHA